jgi:hypothetical protein
MHLHLIPMKLIPFYLLSLRHFFGSQPTDGCNSAAVLHQNPNLSFARASAVCNIRSQTLVAFQPFVFRSFRRPDRGGPTSISLPYINQVETTAG